MANIIPRHFGRLIAGSLFLSLVLPCASGEASQGYIDRAAFDITSVLPEAPSPGSPRYQADKEIFRQTRALKGSPRWVMAISDVPTDVVAMMRDFSCSAGINLTPANAPHLAILMSRASSDTGAETAAAKDHFKRSRPFLIDRGPICEPASDVAGSYDYPSGHTTLGWTWATILAELLPDHGTAILARGRAFGESRIVCGVHNASAVEAGRVSAAATLSVVRATAAYQADFAAARSELLNLAATAPLPTPDLCKEEADLVSQDVVDGRTGRSNP